MEDILNFEILFLLEKSLDRSQNAVTRLVEKKKKIK